MNKENILLNALNKVGKMYKHKNGITLIKIDKESVRAMKMETIKLDKPNVREDKMKEPAFK